MYMALIHITVIELNNFVLHILLHGMEHYKNVILRIAQFHLILDCKKLIS